MLGRQAAIRAKSLPNGGTYVGEWSEGRMHGVGSYRSPDGAEYRGDLVKGQISGRGEKVWPNGRKYVGSWRQDMIWGEGEMVWPSGEVYRGQFRANAFHGRGERCWPNGDIYVGEFAEGELEGDGRFTEAATGEVYMGQWLHGRMYGPGRVEFSNGITYAGEFVDGVPQGVGKQTWPDGTFYEGPFYLNCAEGNGRKVFANGSWFEGHFVHGKFEGHGVFHAQDGTEFEGLWHESQIAGPGCSRLPDGTAIYGVFKENGACGDGKKVWVCGCEYTGSLLRNTIDRYGTLNWPDGRSYIGCFQDNRLHGDGALVWTDEGGICTYRGHFENNVFHGEGKLVWSSGARYEGTFCDGRYHGEGTFRWPNKSGYYRGSWVRGEMSGKGVLKFSPSDGEASSYSYVGTFLRGQMEGAGSVTFHNNDRSIDQYQGDFHDSRFSGRGTFTWGDGMQLEGLFEEGYCNRVGRKVYPNGSMYTGELRYDLEHGKGSMSETGGRTYVAFWRDGEVVKELLGSCAPEFDLVDVPHAGQGSAHGLSAGPGSGSPLAVWSSVSPRGGGARPGGSGGSFMPLALDTRDEIAEDPDEEEAAQEEADRELPFERMSLLRSSPVSSRGDMDGNTFQQSPSCGAPRKKLLPVMDEHGKLVNGKALVVFLNGDRYVGNMKGGRKHGRGMYVYADLVTYRGMWQEDILDGVRHPVTEDCMPTEVKRLGAMILEQLPSLGSPSLCSDEDGSNASEAVQSPKFADWRLRGSPHKRGV